MRTVQTLHDPEFDGHAPEAPPAAALVTKKSKITVQDAATAAKRAGLAVIPAEHIVAHKVLGEFLDQEGAIPVGRSLLIMAHQNLGRGVDKCVDLITDDCPTEDLISLMKCLHDMTKVQVEAANGLIKSAAYANNASRDDHDPVQPFGPRQMVVPLKIGTVNINGSKNDGIQSESNDGRVDGEQ